MYSCRMNTMSHTVEIPGVGAVERGAPRDRALGALLGLAVGDALGTTYEFEVIDQPPYPALAAGPATDLVGGGPFALAAGQVTDDTQLAVCLARTLAAHGRLEPADLAARFLAWWPHAFDCGNQTAAALRRLELGDPPAQAGRAAWRASGRRAAGNGSLMRTAPLAVALRDRPDQLLDAAIAESLITHADPRCALACAAFDAAIAALLSAPAFPAALASAGAALDGAARCLTELWRDDADDVACVAPAAAELRRDLEVATGDEPGLYGAELHLHRTAGYVRVAFRLAFWHAHHTPSWRDAVIDVASRGGDADTNTAIAGALLGARDGASAIPPAWIERVLGATQRGPAGWAEAHHPRHLLALAPQP